MWLYNDEVFEDLKEYVGYVYLITNLTNNKKYVGKKTFYFSKTKKIKGKNKKYKVESDWKLYWSSSKILQEDVKNLGENNFKREILHLCKNKSQMSYFELKEQIDRRVMEKEEYYNEYIMARIHKTKSLMEI